MASLTQVGIIVAEIGLGLHYFALIHIIGHACMRSLQLLRAPTLLRDYRTLENAIGGRLNQAPPRLIQRWSPTAQLRAYRFFMERGYLDAWLDGWIVRPFQKSFQLFDRWERGSTDWLSGKQSREIRHYRAPSRSRRGPRMINWPRIAFAIGLNCRYCYRYSEACGSRAYRKRIECAVSAWLCRHYRWPARSGLGSTSATCMCSRRTITGTCWPRLQAKSFFAIDELSSPLLPAGRTANSS